jgi:hypothetical protein
MVATLLCPISLCTSATSAPASSMSRAKGFAGLVRESRGRNRRSTSTIARFDAPQSALRLQGQPAPKRLRKQLKSARFSTGGVVLPSQLA